MIDYEDKSVNWERRNAECKERADPHEDRAWVRLDGKVFGKVKEEENTNAVRQHQRQDVLGATENEILSRGV